MDNDWNIEVPIPDDLDEVIRRGISQGQRCAARRDRRRQLAIRSACSLVLLVCVFIGGIRFSPAFAAAVSEIPVLGELVQVFGKNQPLAQGGSQQGDGTALLTMERSGDTEWMRLEFGYADASLYRAEFSSFPKTITITLPGTSGVEILSEISRAKDTSQYIKSVYHLPTSTPESAAVQLELESDADVQIQEYRNPGSLVIRLTPAQEQVEPVYSLRTLSFDAEGIREAAGQYTQQSVRVLRDDAGEFFLELAQFTTEEEAETACRDSQDTLIVERRVGNNVPVCFETIEAYESSRFLDQYYQVLKQADSIEPVLDFLDQHFAQASPQEQDTMLRGLTGLLEDEAEEVDWERAAAFYRAAGQELPEQLQQYFMR